MTKKAGEIDFKRVKEEVMKELGASSGSDPMRTMLEDITRSQEKIARYLMILQARQEKSSRDVGVLQDTVSRAASLLESVLDELGQARDDYIEVKKNWPKSLPSWATTATDWMSSRSTSSVSRTLDRLMRTSPEYDEASEK